MKRKTLIVLLLFGLIATGCASFSSLSRPARGGEERVLAGSGDVTAEIDDGALRISVRIYHERDSVRFDVEIVNLTQETVPVSEKNVLIRQGVDADHLGNAAATYSATEYYKIRTGSSNMIACCLLLGSWNADDEADRHPSYRNDSAAFEAEAAFNDHLDDSAKELDDLNQTLLYTTEIPPGGSVAGSVYGTLSRTANDPAILMEPNFVSLTLRIKEKDYVFIFELVND